MSGLTVSDLCTALRAIHKVKSALDSAIQLYTSVEETEGHLASLLRIAIVPSFALEEARLIEMPYSEVCMHMRVAGELMWAIPLGPEPHSPIQLYTLEGQRFSIPITRGEAGWNASTLQVA